MWLCPNCGRSIAAPAGITVYCSCGAHDSNPDEYLKQAGRRAWGLLHRYPTEHQHDWDPVEAKRWYEEEWLPLIPRFGCDCESKWRWLTLTHPPRFESADTFLRWTVDRHNDVNIILGKKLYPNLLDHVECLANGHQEPELNRDPALSSEQTQ